MSSNVLKNCHFNFLFVFCQLSNGNVSEWLFASFSFLLSIQQQQQQQQFFQHFFLHKAWISLLSNGTHKAREIWIKGMAKYLLHCYPRKSFQLLHKTAFIHLQGQSRKICQQCTWKCFQLTTQKCGFKIADQRRKKCPGLTGNGKSGN